MERNKAFRGCSRRKLRGGSELKEGAQSCELRMRAVAQGTGNALLNPGRAARTASRSSQRSSVLGAGRPAVRASSRAYR